MKRIIFIAFVLTQFITPAGCGQNLMNKHETVFKIEMNLSAFGVESDNFPSIVATIDLSKNKSTCTKSYFNPKYQTATYSLSNVEMASLKLLLKISEIKKLKPDYKILATDQPTSKTKIYTNRRIFIINDYGLVGDNPLTELYRIVYKLQ